MLQMTLEFFSMVGGYLRKVCILECTLCITTHSSSCLVICNILKGHAKENSCFVAFVSYIIKRLTKGVCVLNLVSGYKPVRDPPGHCGQGFLTSTDYMSSLLSWYHPVSKHHVMCTI